MRLALPLCLCVALGAADVAWPQLPDPIGLGPRLVTIQALRDEGEHVDPNASDADLVEAYQRRHPPAGVTVTDNGERSRLLYLLRARHGFAAPDDATDDVLRRLLLTLDRAAAAKVSGLRVPRVSIAPPSDAQTASSPNDGAAAHSVSQISERQTDGMYVMEVVYGRETRTVYRFPDGHGTGVDTYWRGDDYRVESYRIPPSPTSTDGWSQGALAFKCGAYIKDKHVLLVNNDDARKLITATIDGDTFAAVVPGNSRCVAGGVTTWRAISSTVSVTLSDPLYEIEGKTPVVTVGKP